MIQDIKELDDKINQMINIIGTDVEADVLQAELNQELKMNNPQIANDKLIKVQKENFAQILEFMQNTKQDLLENKEDLKSYFEKIKKNKVLLENFSNYASISLNIRDKCRLIMHIKDDLMELNQRLQQLEQFQGQLEEMVKLQNEVENKMDETQQQRLQKLIDRATQQQQDVDNILEVYKDMVSFINDKIIKQNN